MRRWFMPIAALAVALAVGAPSAFASDRGHDRNGDGRGKRAERIDPGPSYGHAPRHGKRDRHMRDRGHREWGHGDRRGHQRWHRRRGWRDHGRWRHGPRHGHGKRAFVSPCHPTRNVIHNRHGERVIVGGVVCYDAHGTSYLVPGSRHVIARF
jgi:hypothetical protein